MNRLREYIGFAVRFAGLGYAAIWPLSANGTSGELFGASLLCHAHPAFGVFPMLCHIAHPLSLPPTLHMLGLLLAIVVALGLLRRLLQRARRRRAAKAIEARRDRNSAALKPAPPPVLLRRLPQVKPRSQFGLRGVPR